MTVPQLDPDIRHKAVQAAADLRERGWAVLDGILPESECKAYIDGLWTWLESLGTGISRDDPATWRAPTWPANFRGIINTLAVCHQPFVLRVRKADRIRQVFAALWGTNELLSSFDSINCNPPGTPPAGPASWLHTDQGPQRGKLCIQGLVNLCPVSAETTGTILFKDRSHKLHALFYDEVCTTPREKQASIADFYQFNAQELPFFDQFPTVTPSGVPGSLFLWDSRCAHQNSLPETPSDWRQVCYTCYQPRALATDADLAVKREGWYDWRVSTHWPAFNVNLFPAGPEYYQTNSGEKGGARHITHRDRGAEEDTLARQLAGVQPYPADSVWRDRPLLELSLEELQQQGARI